MPSALFREAPTDTIGIAEICAHSLLRPIPDLAQTQDCRVRARSEFDNLILLCPSCHTIVDKREADYPPPTQYARGNQNTAIRSTKYSVFDTSNLEEKLVNQSDQLLVQNRVTWERFGPDNDYRFDPESQYAALWRRYALRTIVPNNRLILRILKRNIHLLVSEERSVLAEFRLHVSDFEARHVSLEPVSVGIRFPSKMNSILKEEVLCELGVMGGRLRGVARQLRKHTAVVKSELGPGPRNYR